MTPAVVRQFSLGIAALALVAACSGSPSSGAGSASGTAGGTGGTGGTGGSGATGGTGTGAPWHSGLYPEDWTPAFAKDGHRLPDFSYAGYHHGQQPFGAPSDASVFDVGDFGADATGGSDATMALQAAIDAAQKSGGVVRFAPGLYRIDGQLVVRSSKVVLRGAGSDKTQLAFTKSAGMAYQSHLSFTGELAFANEQPLAADGEAFSVTVKVADAQGFAVGDDVAIGWIVSDAFIAEHQMTGTWDQGNAFAHSWVPFFLRQVVAVDVTAQTITLDVPLRYPAKVRDQASIRVQTGYLSECGVESLAIGNAVSWSDAWAENQVHAISLTGSKNCWLHELRSFSPPGAPQSGKGAGAHLQSGGILVARSKSITVAASEMHAAQNKGGGGNGYLFEVSQSNEVLFRDLVATGGRHNFIQNWGFGTTGCVWLGIHSEGGEAWLDEDTPGLVGSSEFHHSLALANLIDHSRFDDGFAIVNRGSQSTYAGHTGTLDVMWNLRGAGRLRSRQFGNGYVIGTSNLDVQTTLEGIVLDGAGTAPEDYTEGIGVGSELVPKSLYQDQLARRLGR